MADRVAGAEILGRHPANRAVLDLVRADAVPAPEGVGPWSPDGWVMRTHPDLAEALGSAAPDDQRIILGVSALVTPKDVIYAVAWGTSMIWLRVPSGPAFDDALTADDVAALAELAGWIALRAWRDDLATWVRASRILTIDLVGG
jgi:hypothetical protein